LGVKLETHKIYTHTFKTKDEAANF